MGYRLHVRKRNLIEYGCALFSGGESEEVNRMLRRLCGEGITMDAEESILEINRESLKKAVETIKAMSENDFAHEYPVTAANTGRQQLINDLLSMLEQGDPEDESYITADWF